MNWKPQYAYAYPDDNDPEVKQLKRLAAKCGRAYRQAEKFEQHKKSCGNLWKPWTKSD